MAQELEEDHPPAVEALNIDDTSLGIVLSLVGLHMSCRDLIRLQLVSKEWQKWCSETAPSLLKAWKPDYVTDWYFPIELVSHEKTLSSPRHWYGIHHPSEAVHRLPGLEFLDIGRNLRVEVSTGAGGLLLLYAVCERKRKIRVGRVIMNETVLWKRQLIVCNPLTKRWRALSEMNQSIPDKLKYLYRALLNFVNRHPSKDDPGLVAIHKVVNEFRNYEIVIIFGRRDGHPKIIWLKYTTLGWFGGRPPHHQNTKNSRSEVCASTVASTCWCILISGLLQK